MSSFIFKSSNGEVFTVTGPDSMTADQAEAIWRQQRDTGALDGIKVGSTVSAATQAAGGLTSALPQLSQSLASANGLIPKGINLNSITAGLGISGLPSFNQISSSLTGSKTALASNVTGSSAGINGLITGSGASAVIGALTGSATAPGSIARRAVETATGLLGLTPTQGINTANMAKQIPALGSIGNLNANQVTGTLAQASKLLGQSSSDISDSKGAGMFGLDTKQLEQAGYVKPGTADKFGADNSLTSILKSPTVWTGKDGVNSVGSILDNPNLQNKIQQGLMSTGVSSLKQLGVPTDLLSPQALGGIATNAAKSVSDTAKWLTGSSDLGSGVKSAMDSIASNTSFAINFTDFKLDSSVLKERIAVPAVNTINAQTVIAAASRVVGNAKVPSVLGG